MKTEPKDPLKSDSLVPSLGKTMKHVDMLIKSRFNEAGMDLTKAQFILLKFLYSGPQPQSALAIITERDKGSLTRLVQSMERKKLVKRRTSKEDQRVNVVELTPLGFEFLENAKPVIQGLFSTLSKGIEKDEQEIAMRVLKCIRHNAAEALGKEYNNESNINNH